MKTYDNGEDAQLFSRYTHFKKSEFVPFLQKGADDGHFKDVRGRGNFSLTADCPKGVKQKYLYLIYGNRRWFLNENG